LAAVLVAEAPEVAPEEGPGEAEGLAPCRDLDLALLIAKVK